MKKQTAPKTECDPSDHSFERFDVANTVNAFCRKCGKVINIWSLKQES